MFEWIDSLPLVPAVIILLVVIYLRAGATYALGRTATRLANRGRTRTLIESAQVCKAIATINRYGAPIVALSFLTIGFQTACNLAAGATRMPLRLYLPALALGGFAWAVLYATVGLAAFSLWWRIALSRPLIGAFILLVAVGLLARFAYVRRTRKDATELVSEAAPPYSDSARGHDAHTRD